MTLAGRCSSKSRVFLSGPFSVPWAASGADAIEQVVGDQSGQKERIVGPEAVGANTRGGKIVFQFLDDLFHHGTAVVKPPDILSIEMQVGHHNLIAAVHHLEQGQLSRLFFGRQVSLNHRHATGTFPSIELAVDVGGKMTVAKGPPILDL